MKKMILSILFLCLFIGGCVSMPPSYRKELDSSVILTKTSVRLAESGEFSQEQTVVLLKNVYVMLRTWQDSADLKIKSGVNSTQYLNAIREELKSNAE